MGAGATGGLAQEFEVRLRSRTLSGATHDPKLVAELERLAAAPPPRTGRVHAVLRFRGPLSPEQHRALRDEGIRLLSYLGNHGYFASLPAEARLGKGALAPLGGSDLLLPDDKLERALLARRSPRASALWFDRPGDAVAVVVEFFSDVTPEDARAIVTPFSISAAREGPLTWKAIVPRDRLRDLASEDPVKRISPGPLPPALLTNEQRKLTGSEDAQKIDRQVPRPAFRVDGTPIRIGICDDGIDAEHKDFMEVTSDGFPGAGRIDPRQVVGKAHGTSVASIASGTGYESKGYDSSADTFAYRGHAPYSRLGDYPRFRTQIDQVFGALVEDGMHVLNHSYVQSLTIYDSAAAELDLIVRGGAVHSGSSIPARPQVWAAGNNGVAADPTELGGKERGYHSVHTSAKNTISVGSVNAPDDSLSPFTSLGPTFDGRIKPDLVAPGWRPLTGVRAAHVHTSGYEAAKGTSVAAPAVTGILALLMHQYEKTHGVFPELLPSTYKAILVHTAEDLEESGDNRNSPTFPNPDTLERVRFHEGPDFATGWGRVDAERARLLVAEGGRFIEGRIQATGARDVHCVDVPAGASELAATIAWDDLPGDTSTPETAPKLVNDLDLLLVGPGPQEPKFFPWVIDPLPGLTESPEEGVKEQLSAADIEPAYRGESGDHRNNVERVTTAQPAPGIWRVWVTGYSLPMEVGQSYGLVASHPISPCARPEVVSDRPKVRLPNRSFEPGSGIDEALRAKLANLTAGDVEAVLAFDRLPTEAERRQLAGSGIEIRQYLGASTYVARIRAGSDLTRIPAGLRLEWAEALRPEDKLHPQLWKAFREPPPPTGVLDVVIYFQGEVSEEAAKTVMRKFSRAEPRRYGPPDVWAIEIPPQRLERLASETSVRWLEQADDDPLPLGAP